MHSPFEASNEIVHILYLIVLAYLLMACLRILFKSSELSWIPFKLSPDSEIVYLPCMKYFF